MEFVWVEADHKKPFKNTHICVILAEYVDKTTDQHQLGVACDTAL